MSKKLTVNTDGTSSVNIDDIEIDENPCPSSGGSDTAPYDIKDDLEKTFTKQDFQYALKRAVTPIER